jgi:hypothetical protein
MRCNSDASRRGRSCAGVRVLVRVAGSFEGGNFTTKSGRVEFDGRAARAVAARTKPFTLDSRGVAKKFQRGVRVWLREEREQSAGKVEDGGKGFGRLPAERGRARRGVNEHER